MHSTRSWHSPSITFGNRQPKEIPHLAEGSSSVPCPHVSDQSWPYNTCRCKIIQLYLGGHGAGIFVASLGLLHFSTSVSLRCPGLTLSSCLQLQIKTEDLSDSLQQTLPHRPCHLSQAPAMMSGNQMSGVSAPWPSPHHAMGPLCLGCAWGGVCAIPLPAAGPSDLAIYEYKLSQGASCRPQEEEIQGDVGEEMGLPSSPPTGRAGPGAWH